MPSDSLSGGFFIAGKGGTMRDRHSIGVWLFAAAAFLFVLISGAVKPVSGAQAAQNEQISKSFRKPLKVSMRVEKQSVVSAHIVYRPVTVRAYQTITYQKLVRR